MTNPVIRWVCSRVLAPLSSSLWCSSADSFFVMMSAFCDDVSVVLAVVCSIPTQPGLVKDWWSCFLSSFWHFLTWECMLTHSLLALHYGGRTPVCQWALQSLHMTCSLQSNVRRRTLCGSKPRNFGSYTPYNATEKPVLSFVCTSCCNAVFPTLHWDSRMI